MKFIARVRFGLEAGSNAASVLASTTDSSGGAPTRVIQNKGTARSSKKNRDNVKGVIFFKINPLRFIVLSNYLTFSEFYLMICLLRLNGIVLMKKI